MLFRHNEQPFLDDNPCQFAYKNLKEWDYPASLPEFFKFSTEKQPIPGRESQCMEGDDAHVFSAIAKEFEDEFHQRKRPFTDADDGPYEAKRTRLDDQNPENRDSGSVSPVHRKPIPVGPDHQAELPMWTSRDTCLRSSHEGDGLLSSSVGNPSIGCECRDEGSIRCVRQHVMEAREGLKRSVGIERFGELGFFQMGEEVVRGWSRDEERLFHKVVASNPVSMGLNFWDELPRAFPSRSSKELVSYYFNVFVLRKRTEQNRLDPLHADSDDDEWEAMDSGDDDLVMESLYDREFEGHSDCEEEELSADGWMGEMLQFSPDGLGKCSSEDSEEFGQEGLRAINCHEYIMGDYDQERWTAGFGRGMGKGVEFLPTSNVIEEVFGKEINGV